MKKITVIKNFLCYLLLSEKKERKERKKEREFEFSVGYPCNDFLGKSLEDYRYENSNYLKKGDYSRPVRFVRTEDVKNTVSTSDSGLRISDYFLPLRFVFFEFFSKLTASSASLHFDVL